MRLPIMLWPGLVWVLLSASVAADELTEPPLPGVKTAKERLVNKAADAQRLNDCKVPEEQRDASHPRPDGCGDAIEDEASEVNKKTDELR